MVENVIGELWSELEEGRHSFFSSRSVVTPNVFLARNTFVAVYNGCILKVLWFGAHRAIESGSLVVTTILG